MNQNVIEGKWNEIKGDILKTWGKLTDDEVEKAKGNLKGLSGIVQQKFGIAQEEVARKLNGILDKYKEKNSAENGNVEQNRHQDSRPALLAQVGNLFNGGERNLPISLFLHQQNFFGRCGYYFQLKTATAFLSMPHGSWVL
jgi:uncharacterized protein YjbJ (UPF0337 family)